MGTQAMPAQVLSCDVAAPRVGAKKWVSREVIAQLLCYSNVSFRKVMEQENGATLREVHMNGKIYINVSPQ